jgi:adenosylcobinamide-phosphate guanylyltransferase
VDALVMCGGRGTRLDLDVEKPLLPVAGEPTVEHVLGALAASRVRDRYAVVSPGAPRTAERVPDPTIQTPGEGYVADLRAATDDDRVSPPVVTVAADLPLLDGAVVDRILDVYDGTGSLTVAVPVARKRALGVSVDTSFERDGRDLAPAGVNVVGDGPDVTRVVDDDRLAVNVNRPRDARVAEALLDA